jgi:hypothetical protein
LKKAGFQKNKGVIPHFRNIEKIMKNQPKPRDKIEVLELTNTRYEKICSVKNQSNVTSVV